MIQIVRECKQHAEGVEELREKGDDGDYGADSVIKKSLVENILNPLAFVSIMLPDDRQVRMTNDDRFLANTVSCGVQESDLGLGENERGNLQTLFRLDLHGLSQAEATVALHTRLSQLATIHCVGINNLFKEIWKEEKANNGQLRAMAKKLGLVILVGKGLHAYNPNAGDDNGADDDDDVLGGLIERLLAKRKLKGRLLHGNHGRIVVSGQDLAAWLDEQRRSHHEDVMRGSAGLRVFFMGACCASAAAFFIVVPSLLHYASGNM